MDGFGTGLVDVFNVMGSLRAYDPKRRKNNCASEPTDGILLFCNLPLQPDREQE